MHSVQIQGNKEWEVIQANGAHWRIGVYRPKYRAAAEITELERHTCPEAFLLLKGDITILYKKADGSLAEKALQPMELTTFEESHAGFSTSGDGIALVVENGAFETTYTDIRSGAFTRKVAVVDDGPAVHAAYKNR